MGKGEQKREKIKGKWKMENGKENRENGKRGREKGKGKKGKREQQQGTIDKGKVLHIKCET